MPDLEKPDLPDEDEWKYPSWFPANWATPTIKVKHSDLPLYSEDSYFKRECQWCDDGIFLVKRDINTMKILAEDSCVGCAQQVIYTDIEEMRGVFKDPRPKEEADAFMQDLRDQYQSGQKKTPEESGEPSAVEESEG